MGATGGTYRRYAVEGGIQDLERIKSRAFIPLTVEDDGPNIGWVPFGSPLGRFDDQAVRPTPRHLALGLRIDHWRLPAALKKAKLAEAKEAYLVKTGRVRLGRVEKDTIAEQVERALREASTPSMSVVEVVWDTSANVVRVWSSSTAVNDIFLELFEETFGCRLKARSPYTIRGDDRLLTLAPSSFALGRLGEPLDVSSTADLFERVEATRFVGVEFMTWLWAQVAEGRSLFCTDLEVELEQAITFESLGERTSLAGGPSSDAPEAREAVRQGKCVARSKLRLLRNSQQWALTLTGRDLGVAGLKIPAVLSKEDDDRFDERMLLIDEADALVDELFADFVELRVSERWGERLAELHAWLGQA